jgi:hypothetical protein
MSRSRQELLSSLGSLLDSAVAEIDSDNPDRAYEERIREQIRIIGFEAATIMNLEQMMELAEDAASASGKDWGVRIDIIDKWWDDIRDKNGSPWLA